MDHFLSPAACSHPIRAEPFRIGFIPGVVRDDHEGRPGINFKATSLAVSFYFVRFACAPRMCACNPLKGPVTLTLPPGENLKDGSHLSDWLIDVSV